GMCSCLSIWKASPCHEPGSVPTAARVACGRKESSKEAEHQRRKAASKLRTAASTIDIHHIKRVNGTYGHDVAQRFDAAQAQAALQNGFAALTPLRDGTDTTACMSSIPTRGSAAGRRCAGAQRR